ncbi:MAG: orotidine-5'-phosphate decarboxylase [Rhodospirillaceae bacterium]|jgi:orotidine-5'-phosphate decarboxylase|nr:orotidine-5'-phosphate decarboxylase [Rhodospirillaceae bacterium]
MFHNPVFCAIDTADLQKAMILASCLDGLVGGLKLGIEFFSTNGLDGVRAIIKFGLPLFLDLKFHDIPNSVAGAIRSIVRLKPTMITVHSCGGYEMMVAAVNASSSASVEYGVMRPKLLAVTVLTSMNQSDLKQSGVDRKLIDQVKCLTTLAQEANVDGVVCSPHELEILRSYCDSDFLLVTPGIRPVWTMIDDQKRTLTPIEALNKGADILVIGRPITAANDPKIAAKMICDELIGIKNDY